MARAQNTGPKFFRAAMMRRIALTLCLSLALQFSLATAARSQPRWKRGGPASVPVTLIEPKKDGYFARITLGTPPRDFMVLADTGSELLWVQCDPCVECLPDIPVFQTKTSTSFQTLSCSNSYCSYLNSTDPGSTVCNMSPDTCSYELAYGLGATLGDLASEVLTVITEGGLAETYPNIVFGCSHLSSADTKYPILGLSRGPLSLVSQLGPKLGNGFSFCFASYYEDGKVTDLVIGSRGKKGLKFTPLVPNPVVPGGVEDLFYYVNVTGISVDGVPVKIPTDAFEIPSDGIGGTFLDTGTTYSLWVPEVFSPLASAVTSNINYPRYKNSSSDSSLDGLEFCFNTASDAIYPRQLELPSITFHFQDLDYPLSSDTAFRVYPRKHGSVVCLAMFGGSDVNIFGNYQMQDHYYFFDLDNNRVGIKPEIC